MKKTKIVSLVVMMVGAALASTHVLAKERMNGRGTGPVVYVESQGLFYDSIVLTELPPNGNFQLLKTGVGPSGLATEFGPGDVGYLGGRWWVDANGNGYQDADDSFFLCPLLGPGRSVH